MNSNALITYYLLLFILFALISVVVTTGSILNFVPTFNAMFFQFFVLSVIIGAICAEANQSFRCWLLKFLQYWALSTYCGLLGVSFSSCFVDLPLVPGMSAGALIGVYISHWKSFGKQSLVYWGRLTIIAFTAGFIVMPFFLNRIGREKLVYVYIISAVVTMTILHLTGLFRNNKNNDSEPLSNDKWGIRRNLAFYAFLAILGTVSILFNNSRYYSTNTSIVDNFGYPSYIGTEYGYWNYICFLPIERKADLVRIGQMQKLEILDLINYPHLITDNDLKLFKGLKHLKKLRLQCSDITLAGIAYLKDMEQLSELNLGVSDKMSEEIQRALQQCKIIR